MNSNRLFRTLVLLLLGTFPFDTFSQVVSEKSDLSKSKVKRYTIISTDYKNGIRHDSCKINATIDSLGRTKDWKFYNCITNDSSIINYTYSENSDTVIAHDTWYSGTKITWETIDIRITRGEFYRHIQTSGKGDTLVYQENAAEKTVHNIPAHDSIMAYDSDNNLVSKTLVDKNKKPLRKYEYDNNCVKYFYNRGYSSTVNWILYTHKCQIGDENIFYYLDDGTGYLFGIKIVHEAGGKVITKRDSENLITEILYENKAGQIIAKLLFLYER